MPFPTPEDLPDSRIKPKSLVSPASAGAFFTAEPPRSSLVLLTLEALREVNGNSVVRESLKTISRGKTDPKVWETKFAQSAVYLEGGLNGS